MSLKNLTTSLMRFLNIKNNLHYLAVISVNTFLVLLRVYEISYDAYTHMFFAKHYMEDWFSLWETKWYGGFMITGYPPLSHQIVAILAKFIDLSYAFGIVLMFSIILLIYAITKFFENLLKTETKLIPVLLMFTPSIYLFAYCFGQLPTILATSFTILAATYFKKSLVSRGLKSLPILLLASMYGSLTIITHHITAFFLLPSLILTTFLEYIVNSKRTRKFLLNILAKLALFTILALIFSLPIIYHIVKFILTTPRQAPIPHASRENIFNDIVSSITFFWGVYGPLAILLPLAFYVLLDKRRYVLTIYLLMLFIFGLGGVTPIPRLLLGNELYEILTFDKFSFWTSILAVPLVAYYLKYELGGLTAKTLLTIRIVLLLFIISSTLTVLMPRAIPLQPPRPDIDAIANYLNEQEGMGFYVTLGLGTWFQELSLKTNKPTLDGGYNTARTIPVLVHSGVESIDSAKIFPNGTVFINILLSRAGDYGIRWVIVGDKAFEKIVSEKGFRKVFEVGNVTIWERKDYVKGFLRTYRQKNIRSYLWGIIPLAILSLTIIVNIWYRLWRIES